MARRLAFLTGGIAVAGAALWRLLRRQPREWGADQVPVDPRAEELRRRLDESRAVVDDRDEFEGAETPIDEAAEPVQDPADRRREVHAEGRSAVERMRRGPSPEE